jgi:hypothetical protein
MKITFDRKWTGMILIKDEAGEVVGEITHRYRDRKKPACETCGHVRTEQVVRGFGLQINGRCFGPDNELRPKGKGGYSGMNVKRLKDAKAKAEELLA